MAFHHGESEYELNLQRVLSCSFLGTFLGIMSVIAGIMWSNNIVNGLSDLQDAQTAALVWEVGIVISLASMFLSVLVIWSLVKEKT